MHRRVICSRLVGGPTLQEWETSLSDGLSFLSFILAVASVVDSPQRQDDTKALGMPRRDSETAFSQ